MICAYLCSLAKSALEETLGDSVSVTVGPPPVTSESAKVYIHVPKLSYSRRTFAADAEDKTQRITVYLNVVYYPRLPVDASNGRSDIFKTLGTVEISTSEYKIESYTAVTNHAHYDITIGYSLPISYFGVED